MSSQRPSVTTPVAPLAPGGRKGLSASEARSLCDRVLSEASATQTQVVLTSGFRGFTRSADNRLTTGGGSDSLEERIASTERGVLITRFWYIRGLNPRTLAYTGLTRDGTFLIKNGMIARPVNNFRFNQSLAEMLTKVDAIGPSIRVAAQPGSD